MVKFILFMICKINLNTAIKKSQIVEYLIIQRLIIPPWPDCGVILMDMNEETKGLFCRFIKKDGAG
jgi:hypothetical protein